MKICVSAMSGSLEAKVSERFGRAPYFVIVESEDMSFIPVLNAAVTGELGGNAKTAIEAAGIKGVTGVSGEKTVRQAVEEYLKK